MIGLISIVVVAILMIGYIIYRNWKRKNEPVIIDEPEDPIDFGNINNPIENINEFVGEANPSYSSPESACSVQHTRLYYVRSIGTNPTIIEGDILYNKYPAEPTHGGGNWIGLENIGNGEKNVVKVDSTGTILEVYLCN